MFVLVLFGLSRPAWGGWIEIFDDVVSSFPIRPAPHGAGGLKSFLMWLIGQFFGVPPRMGRVD